MQIQLLLRVCCPIFLILSFNIQSLDPNPTFTKTLTLCRISSNFAIWFKTQYICEYEVISGTKLRVSIRFSLKYHLNSIKKVAIMSVN